MKAAVLGSPIAHSLSPVLHQAGYRALGLAGWAYQAVECDEARLPGLISGCGPDWAGLSLTMPLKRAVLPLLDEAEPLVAEVGAANTVIFDAGRRSGHNTDVPGMIAALAESLPDQEDGRPGSLAGLARGSDRAASSWARARRPAPRWPRCAGWASRKRRWPSGTRAGRHLRGRRGAARHGRPDRLL